MQYEDIEVGMRVKVVRRTEDHNAGWDNTWNPEMRKTVGSETEVKLWWMSIQELTEKGLAD
jgi:hypothetical protein